MTAVDAKPPTHHVAFRVVLGPPESARSSLYLGADDESEIEKALVAGHKPQISAEVVVWIAGDTPIEPHEVRGRFIFGSTTDLALSGSPHVTGYVLTSPFG